jgi:enoyl-CoA hydratase
VKPPVTLTVRDGLAVVRIDRAHGNAINSDVADGLSRCARQAAQSDEIRGVLLAAAGKLFSPGLDLQELSRLDRADMERFSRDFSTCILDLYAFPKPLVAAIHGHAVAGGCVVTLSADWRILRRGALVGLNEVRVGVPLPFGVSTILRETVPRTHLEEVALLGRNYRDEGALEAGLAHELHPDEGFEEHCLSRLEEFASKDANAFSVTKRYLRSMIVDRIRAEEDRHRGEFLDGWFSPPTQKRIRAIVEELAGTSDSNSS